MDIDTKSVMRKYAIERRKCQITQEKVAEQVNVNVKTISAYENGRKTPSLTTFLKMCSAINVDLSALLKDDD